MDRPRKPAIEALLAGQPVGAWVVLDPEMSRVLGAGRTIDEALREAKSTTIPFALTTGQPPVMIEVPDPSMNCFF
jgi:hypothetical protein